MKTLLCLFLLIGTALEAADAKGYVVVYRLKKFQGSALSPSVACDGQEVAKMTNGRFFTLALTPGTHQLTTNNKGQAVEVAVKPNQVQYVQLIIEVGMAKGHGKLLMIGEGQGSQEAGLVKAIDSDKIKDASLVLTSIPTPDTLAKGSQAAPMMESPAQPATQSVPPAAAKTGTSQPPMDTDTIIDMKKSGLGDELIVTMAQKRGVVALSPEAMVKMKSAGMSEQALTQLIQLSAQ